jgi:hypothetical protein
MIGNDQMNFLLDVALTYRALRRHGEAIAALANRHHSSVPAPEEA